MSSLKNLASQTIWYGLSSIAARFISYLQNPIITYLLADTKGQQAVGDFYVFFAGISLANIVFTYGMETAYFRFSANKENQTGLFRTTFGTLLVSTFCLSIIFILLRHPLATLVHQEAHPEYIIWGVIVIALDTMSAIPFARLRHEGRPKKYAAIRISGILLNLLLTVGILYFSQQYVNHYPSADFSLWFKSHSKGGLLLIPFMAQSAFTFLLLRKEWIDFRFVIDKELLRRLWKYGSPMIIVGLGGMINETMDRFMLLDLYDGSVGEAKAAVAVYGANYKIAIFITLFIQAFKMSAEPFFFKQANEKNAPYTYATVMKWFVITLCFAFLVSALYLDIWKYMNPSTYWNGLKVVPILLAANVCLGIYYNLIVAFKITDHMRSVTYITLIGTAITLIVNFNFIPVYGMMACAYATFICYLVMVIFAFFWGQRYFPVPYPVKTIFFYLLAIIILYLLQVMVAAITPSFFIRFFSATVLLCFFAAFVLIKERSELSRLPVLKRFL